MVSVVRRVPVKAGKLTVAVQLTVPARVSVTSVVVRVTVESAPGTPVERVAPVGTVCDTVGPNQVDILRAR